jgi:hypothetical protein
VLRHPAIRYCCEIPIAPAIDSSISRAALKGGDCPTEQPSVKVGKA